jgi:hypothetical protein
MKRLILLLILALPMVAGAQKHTVVYRNGAYLRLLRPGQTLRDYVVHRYAALHYCVAPGTALIERGDSAAMQGNISADSVIYYDWQDLTAELDTTHVETEDAAREVSKNMKKNDTTVTKDSIVTPQGKIIRLKEK